MPKRLIMLAVLVPLGAAVTWYAVYGTANPARPAPGPKTADAAVPVMIAEARREDVPVFLTGLGTVTAYNSVLIRSRVDGQILKLDFSEGQEVRAGDTLVEIDPKPLKALLSQAQAGMAKDQAQLANAKLDLTRATQLQNSGSVTKQQFDAARALVDQIDASTKVDEAVIDAAEVQLGYTTIRTPIDGRVGTRLVDVGNLVRASDTTGIVTVNQIKPIYVNFSLPQKLFATLQSASGRGGAKVVATVQGSGMVSSGRVTAIDNSADATSGNIGVRATFENTNEGLWPGLLCNVSVTLGRDENAVIIPRAAVLSSQDGNIVFVIEHGAAKVKKVKVDRYEGANAIIASGLDGDETVVTDGQLRLTDGTPVTDAPDKRRPGERS